MPARRFLLATFASALSVLVFAAPPPRPWPDNAFLPLTAERIAALPDDIRPAWLDYWQRSEQLLRQLAVRPRADRSALRPISGPPIGSVHSKGLRLNAADEWYDSDEARTIADHIAAAQMKIGAWKKGTDYTRPVDPTPGENDSPTFDNDATTSELRFLARVISAAGDSARAEWRDAFEHGLRYIFAAQYPNGGFPQVFPLIGGYHDGITYNDDAMTQILEVLRDVAHAQQHYRWIDPALRDEAGTHLALGLDCVLATQLRDSAGRLTGWAQQHDPLTLRAAAARSFEPIADASRESATIAKFLMSLPAPSPAVVAAIEGVIAWFRATALHDLKIATAPRDFRGQAVPSPGAPPLWARFYEPGTATPIFGDRDRTIHYDLSEISSERIAGYAWYTLAPAEALARYERWKSSR
jgi:pectate lyase, PelA/Pel-15E family